MEAAALWSAFSAFNPVRQFQILYCGWLITTLSINMRHHWRFYEWFCSSGCAAVPMASE